MHRNIKHRKRLRSHSVSGEEGASSHGKQRATRCSQGLEGLSLTRSIVVVLRQLYSGWKTTKSVCARSALVVLADGACLWLPR